MPRTWLDRIVQFPKRFLITDNGDGTVTIDPQPGTISQAGTPVTAAWLNGLENDLSSHLTDSMYQLAGGTATAITLTINATLTNGYPITFIANANNSGAATTINGKSLYKPNTTTAPNLTAGKAYTVWYNSSGNCFFIKASAEGDAGVADVLASKKFSTDIDTGMTGTMPNKVGSGTIITPGLSDIVIPQGYYGGALGDGKVLAVPITPGDNTNIFFDATTRNATVASYTKIREAKIISGTGTVRVKFDLACGNTGGTAYGRVYKNGVAVGVEHTASVQTTFADDIAVVPNDLIQIYVKDPTYGAYTYNFGIYINAPSISVNLML